MENDDPRRPVAFRLAVFDLDGTLLDSIADLIVAVNRLVAERGGRRLDEAEVTRMIGEGAGVLVARAFAAAGVDGDPRAAIGRFVEIYDGVLPGQTRPYPGVEQMLRAAARSVPLAVLTNKPTGPTMKILSLLGLSSCFREIIGGDGPFPRKPGAEGLLHLAASAGATPAATLMVGDSPVDLATARAAGTGACIARYGFGWSLFAPGSFAGDEVFVDRPGEVLRILGVPGP